MLLENLEAIDEVFLQSVCDGGWEESSRLDFKQDLGSHQEFAKDVCAMANTEGGDIVYGIAEQEGVAKDLVPISLKTENTDTEEQQLRQILSSHLEPRLSGVQYRWVSVGEGYVLVVRVPQSFIGPHCFGKKENMRFVMRDGAGTKYLSYEELRRFFDRSGTLLKMARDFRTERLEKIKRQEVWGPLSEGPYCVLHWIPLSAMTGQHEIDIHALMRSGNYNKFIRMGGGGTGRPNLDGFRVCFSSGKDSANVHTTSGIAKKTYQRYFWNMQIFRSSALEMAFAMSFDLIGEENKKLIPQGCLAKDLRDAMVGFKDGMLSLGIFGSMLIGVSILFAQDSEFVNSSIRNTGILRSDRENLILPEEWVENLEATENIDEIARPILDTLWQCFGLPRCEYYDENGKWQDS